MAATCGTANLHGYYSTSEIDTADERCYAGTFGGSFVDNGSSWSWDCTGIDGGTTAFCSANKVMCDSLSNLKIFENVPTNFCAYGTASPSTPILGGDNDIWYWACTNNPGMNADCYTYKTTCGSSHGVFSSELPTNLCKYGAPSEVINNSSTYDWTCTGDDSLIVTCQSPKEFSCGNNFTDTRDGKVYSTVQIGSQCWMKENLNYTTGNSWCYGDNSANCDTYGRLYDWNTAMTACPSDWYLPYDVDFINLEEHLECVDAEQTGTRCYGISSKLSNYTPEGNNSSGWTGLLGGARHQSGSYYYLNDPTYGSVGYWWSSTVGGEEKPYFRAIGSTSYGIQRSTMFSNTGFSVRCLKGITNNKPVITNGTLNYSVSVSEQVNFTGFSASDADGDPLSYVWSCLPEGGGTFINNGVANPTYIAPSSPIEDTCYLYVYDGKEVAWSNPVIVSVTGASINGQCGEDDGKLLNLLPANLCNQGNPSEVSGSGPWTWSCIGSGEGSTASCLANKISFNNPLNITGGENCLFCEYYIDYSDGNRLKPGMMTQTGAVPLELNFTIAGTTSFNSFKIGIGTNSSSPSMETSDTIPFSGTGQFSQINIIRSGSDYKPTNNSFNITYGNGTTPKTYYWFVKLTGEDEWRLAGSFNTPKKPFPVVRIAADKSNITIGSNVQYCTTLPNISATTDPCYSVCWKGTTGQLTLNDLTPINTNWRCSICYDNSGNPALCTTNNSQNQFSWTLPESNGTYINSTNNTPNPIFKYNSSITSETIKPGLIISGSECAAEGEAGTTVPLPRWKEVPII